MNLEEIETAAAEKLDADRNARIAAVTDLAKATVSLEDARKKFVDADAKRFELFRAAIRMGWTNTELKGLGIDVPSKNLGGRPRKPKAAAPKLLPTAPESGSSNGDS